MFGLKLGQKKEDTVGLDIGTYSVKVVSVNKETGDNILTAYNIKNIPIQDKKVQTANIVRETLEEIDLHPAEINLSVSGPDVVVRFINLPRMSKDQLENALVFEAEKYIPFNVNEVILDSMILGDSAEAGQMKVLLAAVKRHQIESLLKIMEELDIAINLIDVNPFAIFNAFSGTNTTPDNKGTALIDLGYSQTNVLISTGQEPCFMRQVQIGGRDITLAIARNLSVDIDKAEAYKLGTEEGNKEVIAQAIESVMEDLINEVQLSFGYFENTYSGGIGNIFCTGGMSRHEGIIEHFSKSLGIQASKWDPISSISLAETISKQDMEQFSSQLGVSIGLALRG